MKKKDRTESWKKVWIAAVIFFFFVLLIASFFGERGWIEIYRSQKKKEDLETEIAQLKKQKNRLEKQIEELKNDPEAVEKRAREKLWLMDPKEKVIVK